MTIGAIENAIADAFPKYEVRRAYTSQIIIDKLAQRDGLVIDNVEEVLDRAVADGVATAELVWSSSNYDYMMVNGQKYLSTNTEGNSTFSIPVMCFDKEMTVTADTTAMGTPHELEYTLVFTQQSAKPLESEKGKRYGLEFSIFNFNCGDNRGNGGNLWHKQKK